MPNPRRRAGYHFINMNVESKPPDRLMAFLKTSYDLKDLLPDLEYEINGVREAVELPLPTNLEKELKDGEFVVFNSAIRNFLKVRMIDEATGNIIPSTNHLFTFIFGIRDKKANKILWYLMNLIHPADVPRPADSTSGFTFMGAMKNWEEDRLRETGERLMVIGDSFQPPSEVT